MTEGNPLGRSHAGETPAGSFIPLYPKGANWGTAYYQEELQGALKNTTIVMLFHSSVLSIVACNNAEGTSA